MCAAQLLREGSTLAARVAERNGKHGVITLAGTGAELLERPEVKSAYLEGGRQEVEAGA